MARLPRFVIPDQPQHVILRGNNRTEIFCADADYQFYLEKLQQACAAHGCQLHAYVLMTNHYHLIVQTPEANLSAAIQWIKKGIWPKALLNKGAGLLRVARNDIGGCAGLLDWLDCRVAALLAMTGGCLCERSVAIKVFAVMNGLAAVNIPVRWRSGLLVLYARSYFI